MTWLPFDLHPEIPDGGVDVASWVRNEHGRVEPLLAEASLPFSAPGRVPRTRLALEAGEWVRRQQPDAFPAFHHDLFTAYWAEGRDIGDLAVVLDVAAVRGADTTALAEALSAGVMAPVVAQSTATAMEAGVTGTPAWLLDRRLMVPGAQPREVLGRLVSKLSEAAQP